MLPPNNPRRELGRRSRRQQEAEENTLVTCIPFSTGASTNTDAQLQAGMQSTAAEAQHNTGPAFSYRASERTVTFFCSIDQAIDPIIWRCVLGEHVRRRKAGSSIHGLAPWTAAGAGGCGRWQRRSRGDTEEAQRVASRRLHHRSVASCSSTHMSSASVLQQWQRD